MKFFVWPLLLCLGFGLFASSLQAKPKKKAAQQAAVAPLATPVPEPAPLPSEAAPKVSPDAPPSLSLQPFVDTHLSKILAPLGVSAFAQPELIASLKASYADGMAAAPVARKPAFQAAQSVCDALSSAMTERQTAVAALRGALATRNSEAEQPRGGMAEGTARARSSDNFFLGSQKNAWTQRAEVLRQNITAIYLRERAVERQVGAWPAPAPAPVAATATTPVAPPAEGSDPVAGQWLLGGGSSITLQPDHAITGGRHGFWRYTSTTSGGRNYELHWPPPKNWVDYLVLSSDGKVLEGKTRNNKPMSAFRQ